MRIIFRHSDSDWLYNPHRLCLDTPHGLMPHRIFALAASQAARAASTSLIDGIGYESKIRSKPFGLLSAKYVIIDHLFDSAPTSFQLSLFHYAPQSLRRHIGMAYQLFRVCKVNIYF